MSTDTEIQAPPEQSDRAGDWRGIAKEDDDVTGTGNLVLAGRSRRLLLDLVRPYRKQAALTFALILLDNAAKISLPLFIAYGLDHGIGQGRQGNWTPLLATVAGFVAVTLLAGLTTYFFLRMSGSLSQRVLFDLRVRAFRHTQRLSVSFHEKYTSGKVVTRLTSDIETLQELLEGALNQAFSAILSVVTIAVLLVWLDPMLASIVLLGFVPLVLVTRWAQRRQRAGYRRTRGAIARVVVQFVESMSGMRAVQAFRREDRNQEVLGGEDSEYQQATTTAIRGMGDYVGLSNFIGKVTTVIVLLVGAWQVMEGNLAIGVLAAYLLYLDQFYGPLDELAQVFNSYQSAAAALEKISGVLEEEPAVAEPADPVALDRASGAVRMDGVWFGYHAESAVLPEFDLTIPAGQVVALVGATGAGKSTLAKLLTRFYDPSGGTITLDGVDLRELADAELRRHVVMVTQEAYLFSGTIADNIRLGRPDATDDEVTAAARAVGLDAFVRSLPDGYATDVRTRGGRLSAGQRQLVAFARVFLADPAVIVLDEATSSLDIPGERLVQHALETLLRERTAVIIAHRLSTVAIADRVLVLDAGRIVEDGAPAELIAGQGRFAGLHAAWRDSLV
ncbi:ABC transporter ATP-binding protein [Nocardia asteroides]|uniref:ABC transporter permease/ATP-binding protein n=1 Tax=Nocardia asteroides NBRC 15531 TaxID=1110697 RepID=U5EEI2_NOCAS|nr:ABC transporter ATP-binding protein [Nocardia asteroides]TLF68876.1 ABC transporter ATP-binding protein [Nocardia asteroides NBRC 15531]UGT48342.1 ABC transporter ATP-binding protein/permease [Nocardia asteroides]SFL56375.1 ATP-binding cassette, subfamily B [Nocardia asteroides]VEG32466.1 Putative multidrug export ATP-binding/permease protein SAV1866 [Nocardia asteroides]GAD84833.1 putative ABC transporter permease/ATP-binding protein [Nocardia asteroides NBRC 15531]